MKLTLNNNKDYELFRTYCNEVINSDERCSNCDILRKCVLYNDFDEFLSRYAPLKQLNHIDIDILNEREKDGKEAFNLCKKCIFCYIDEIYYDDWA
ncbi:hypothetical protein [uncultured Clostridium sp.]|uniref:hypothetical protein n=1 Tax=uncultured Clostridium sp. TaxID=59620 RepID=UPI00272CDCAB|nr:hypothetical protein [uncultured Clostridium sp.]